MVYTKTIYIAIAVIFTIQVNGNEIVIRGKGQDGSVSEVRKSQSEFPGGGSSVVITKRIVGPMRIGKLSTPGLRSLSGGLNLSGWPNLFNQQQAPNSNQWSLPQSPMSPAGVPNWTGNMQGQNSYPWSSNDGNNNLQLGSTGNLQRYPNFGYNSYQNSFANRPSGYNPIFNGNNQPYPQWVSNSNTGLNPYENNQGALNYPVTFGSVPNQQPSNYDKFGSQTSFNGFPSGIGSGDAGQPTNFGQAYPQSGFDSLSGNGNQQAPQYLGQQLYPSSFPSYASVIGQEGGQWPSTRSGPEDPLQNNVNGYLPNQSIAPRTLGVGSELGYKKIFPIPLSDVENPTSKLQTGRPSGSLEKRSVDVTEENNAEAHWL